MKYRIRLALAEAVAATAMIYAFLYFALQVS